MGKNKDNPVASIDNCKKITQIYNLIQEYSVGRRTAQNTLDKIEQLFQNARETDKEQPKCKYIKREGESCTKNNLCTFPNCK